MDIKVKISFNVILVKIIDWVKLWLFQKNGYSPNMFLNTRFGHLGRFVVEKWSLVCVSRSWRWSCSCRSVRPNGPLVRPIGVSVRPNGSQKTFDLTLATRPNGYAIRPSWYSYSAEWNPYSPEWAPWNPWLDFNHSPEWVIWLARTE